MLHLGISIAKIGPAQGPFLPRAPCPGLEIFTAESNYPPVVSFQARNNIKINAERWAEKEESTCWRDKNGGGRNRVLRVGNGLAFLTTFDICKSAYFAFVRGTGAVREARLPEILVYEN